MTKEEALQKALRRLKDQKEAKERKNEFEYEYEPKHIDYFAFSKQGEWIPFRLLGRPWEAREESTDTKLFLTSKVLADNGNWYLPVVWPFVLDSRKKTHVPDPDWILTRLYQDIMDGEWKNPTREERLENPDLKGEYRYKYSNSPVFERVKQNARTGEKYPKSFYPVRRVIGNVYDPLDKDFHRINKRSKVLCSRVGSKKKEDGQTVYYPEYGMPFSVYDDIIQIAGVAEGLFSEFDIAVKLDDNIYKTAHYTDIEVRKRFPDLNDEPVEGLTLYDLDEIVPVTRYSTLKKVLGKLFAEWDAYAKRDYSDQLEELCRKEAEETKAKYAEQGKKDPSDNSKRFQIKTPEVKQSTAPSYEELFAKTFPGFHKIPEEEQAYFNTVFDGFDEKNEPKWKKGVDLIPCQGSGDCGRNTLQPSTLEWCSYCGFKFPVD